MENDTPCTVCTVKGYIENSNLSGEECPSPQFDACDPCPGCREISSIDAQIAQARVLLQNLYLKRCDAKLIRNKHHDQLVRRLPVEVVSRIFIHCLPHIPPPPFSLSEYDGRGKREARPERRKLVGLFLAAICQRWRQIAFATPHLWTVARVKISRQTIALDAKLTSEWLRRSGRLPLWLDVYEDEEQTNSLRRWRRHGGKPPVKFDPTPIFDALNPHLSRVEVLEVHTESKYLALLHGEAPILSQLYLSLNSWEVESSSTALRFAGTAPSPQRVILREAPSSAVCINWASLTHFEALSLTLDESLLLLQSSPLLTYFNLGSISSTSTPTFATSSTSVVTHPQTTLAALHTLIVTTSESELLFPHLAAPALQTLHTTGELPVVSSFITRSNCSLQCLTIKALPATPEQFIEVLEKTPLLTELDAWLGQIHDSFFERLAATARIPEYTLVEDAFLPRLRVLTLGGVPYFRLSSIPPIFSLGNAGGNDVDFVYRPLSTFELTLSFYLNPADAPHAGYTHTLIDEEVKKRLKELIKGGKKISIASKTQRTLL
ncbi:unnamed protein product [Cyclocybe aegerita]|uniref:F-box domain-containing protein n=1 Tax=Cyclocybe aegerita TaxID=1973307 RepID=A0A8S0VTV4_CYCAE|nr:unnamed protein product [Cyclocybe aegerita]